MRARLPVVGAAAAVIFDGPRQSFFQSHARLPACRRIEFVGRSINAADVDGLLVRGKRDNTIGAAAGDAQQELNEGFQGYRPLSSQIEVIVPNALVRAGDQKSFNDVINV